jgi:hypothetical protein
MSRQAMRVQRVKMCDSDIVNRESIITIPDIDIIRVFIHNNCVFCIDVGRK